MMTHPGLPLSWVLLIILGMLGSAVWTLFSKAPVRFERRSLKLADKPFLGPVVRWMTGQIWLLLCIKIVFVSLFILIIVAGLWGTPLPQRNLATVLTWNLWWTGVVISVVFFSTSWCAVCPWDTLANWLVKNRLWRRSKNTFQLELSVPRYLRSLWPALLMLVILTWFELGVGVTDNPYATASLALMMVVLATLALVLFEDKAFCRYFCPVGRTVGVYSQLSPVELRPIDSDICNSCDSLACYHGTDTIAPCPTKLVMGKLQESTYCISCGNCTQSCPSQNIAWQLRSPSAEAIQDARPHLDEAFFMLGLLALTSFHGLTMLPQWESWVSSLGQLLNDRGQLVTSFSISLMLYLVAVTGVFSAFVVVTGMLNRSLNFARLFSVFAFSALPLAFGYHVAHNLNHILREGGSLGALFRNPLGLGAEPLSMLEKHQRAGQLLISENWLFTIQSGLIIIGFIIALQVVRYRGFRLLELQKLKLLPMLGFITTISCYHLWLMMQPMLMRM